METRAASAGSVTRLASDLRLACMRVSRRVRFESAGLVAPHQFSVLARLEGTPRTPCELAGIERVSAPSMSRTVAGLCELGYVARHDDPSDGRQVILSLTREGTKVLRDTRRRRDEWMARRLQGLSADELDVLRRAGEILLRVTS